MGVNPSILGVSGPLPVRHYGVVSAVLEFTMEREREERESIEEGLYSRRITT